MALDSRSLEILIAKDSVQDPQWIDSQHFTFLQDNKLSHITASLPIRSRLPYSGSGAYVATEQGILAFQGATLSFVERPRTLIDLSGPAGQIERQENFLSWIESNSKGSDTAVAYSLQSQKAHTIFSREGYIRGLCWNEKRSELAFLSWERHQLPWSSACLFRASYQLQAGLPVAAEARIFHPAGLSAAPCASARYSSCGRYLIASFQTGEFFQLWLWDGSENSWLQLTDSNREHALPARKADPRTFDLHGPSQTLLSLSLGRGFWELDQISFANKAIQKLPCPSWTSLRAPRISPDGNHALLVGSSARQIPDILRFQKNEGEWTLLNAPKPQGMKMEAEAVSWPGRDGRTVQGILYRDRSKAGPLPLIMPIHGGPTDLVDACWPAKAQVFVQQGYAVLYVNYRGSWGYGKSYQQALAGSWGESEVEDIAAAIPNLAALGWIDPQRVAIWGGGVASFTVLWALIRHPNLFRAGIAVFPISNLEHYLQKCSPEQKLEIEWALGPGRLRHSPLNQAEKIKSPLALFHGEEDAQVDPRDLEKLAGILKASNIPCWLTSYPEESNSWKKAGTYEDYYFKVASFLARFMRKGQS